MTEQEALKILTEATAYLKLSRKEHEIIVQALNVIQTTLNKGK